MMQHSAIYVSSKVDKNQLIQQLLKGNLHGCFALLPTLKGELFSKRTQQEFIKEELDHELFEINPNNNRSLVTYSDGEQKKTLLAHLIAKKPDFLVLDNVLDNLDIVSQQQLIDQLASLSSSIIIIQLTNRKNEVLPFISNVYSFKEGELVLQDKQEIPADEEEFSLAVIPPALHETFAQQNPLIKFTHVSVSYDGRPVLNDINWTINAGEFWQLIGPNGSGKSTLLSMIVGDNPKAYNQDLILFGKKKGTGETVWEIKAKIGYVNSMMTHLFSRRNTVEEMVISGFTDSIGLYSKPSNLQTTIADDWLKLIGLLEQKNKVFVDVSAGQQRLVLIARAMVKHPPLLILDEPTVGLDDHDAAIFVSLVNKLAKETTTAIIYVSHRKEQGLKPGFVYELVVDGNGSIGMIR
jgi:molybdate transport system ATP-binding protein